MTWGIALITERQRLQRSASEELEKQMCIMKKRLQNQENVVFNFAVTPMYFETNGAVSSLGLELAAAGDELARKFSKRTVDEPGLEIWGNVKRYALIVAFRLILGIV